MADQGAQAAEVSGARGEVKVFPLLAKGQSDTWRESQQRVVKWSDPIRAAALVKEPESKTILIAFAKRVALAASKVNF